MKTVNAQPKSGTGFTLVELLVAMFITVLIGTIVVMAYNTSMQSYYRTERQLQALAAFRNTTDRMEREVNSAVCKAQVYPFPMVVFKNGGNPTGEDFYFMFWDTRIKYLHADAAINSDPYLYSDGYDKVENLNPENNIMPSVGNYWAAAAAEKSLYRINFRPRYIGYYSSLDGFTVDRAEWYYNPPEEKLLWANGLDDDGDDPEGDVGLRILYDDKGCLMFRKKLDKDMLWQPWRLPADGGPVNDYADLYHGPYCGADFPPQIDGNVGPADGIPDELQGSLDSYWDNDGDGNPDNVDTGTVIGEGFTDLRFYYVYKSKVEGDDKFYYADWWPWDDDNDPTTNGDRSINGVPVKIPTIPIACHVGGKWSYSSGFTGLPAAPVEHQFDISYFSLPLAISAKFTFQVGRQRHVYEKMIYLHASRWLKYMNR